MLCVRCAHPLPPRADRCLRCFALNPQNRPGPVAPPPPAPRAPEPPPGLEEEAAVLSAAEAAWAQGAGFAPGPALLPPVAPAAELAAVRPLALSIDSDPPRRAALAALAIGSDPPAGPTPASPWAAPAPAPDPSPPPRFEEISDPGLAERVLSSLPPPPAPAFHDAVTEPPEAPLPAAARAASPAGPDSLVPEPSLALETTPLPPAAAASAPAPVAAAPPPPARPPRPRHQAQLLAWAVDAALLLACAGLFVGLAAWVLGSARLAPAGSQSLSSWSDQLLFARGLKPAWGALAAALALAYSWLFSALGGRTPGMALARLRLLREDGERLSPARALLRALLALPSAACGLIGFWLALLDPRGQTLHDKLAGAVVVREA